VGAEDLYEEYGLGHDEYFDERRLVRFVITQGQIVQSYRQGQLCPSISVLECMWLDLWSLLFCSITETLTLD